MRVHIKVKVMLIYHKIICAYPVGSITDSRIFHILETALMNFLALSLALDKGNSEKKKT